MRVNYTTGSLNGDAFVTGRGTASIKRDLVKFPQRRGEKNGRKANEKWPPLSRVSLTRITDQRNNDPRSSAETVDTVLQSTREILLLSRRENCRLKQPLSVVAGFQNGGTERSTKFAFFGNE